MKEKPIEQKMCSNCSLKLNGCEIEVYIGQIVKCPQKVESRAKVATS